MIPILHVITGISGLLVGASRHATTGDTITAIRRIHRWFPHNGGCPLVWAEIGQRCPRCGIELDPGDRCDGVEDYPTCPDLWSTWARTLLMSLSDAWNPVMGWGINKVRVIDQSTVAWDHFEMLDPMDRVWVDHRFAGRLGWFRPAASGDVVVKAYKVRIIIRRSRR